VLLQSNERREMIIEKIMTGSCPSKSHGCCCCLLGWLMSWIRDRIDTFDLCHDNFALQLK
jgi:hypothetical protein